MKKLLIIFLLILAFDGYSNPWRQRANFGGTGRHRGTAFAIKDKGYMGLGHVNSVVETVYEDIWEYDPASDTWTQKANFGGGQRYHATAFSVGNKAYVGTGRNESSLAYDDFWEFDPTTNIWTEVAQFPGSPRSGAASFVIDTVGYVGGGTVQTTGSNEFYVYSPETDSWKQVATFPGNERNTGVAFSINDKGYFGTGNGTYDVGNDFWEYKPSQNEWVQRADVGPILREGATGFCINNKGYILAGNDFGLGENYGDVWEYTPEINTWVQIDDFPGAKRRFMVSFVVNNVAYCGTGTNGINFNDFWSFEGTVGIEESTSQSVAPFPNPTNDKVYFKGLENYHDLKIKLYTIRGELIQEKKMTSNSFDCSSFSTGLYMYSLFDGENIISTGKLSVL